MTIETSMMPLMFAAGRSSFLERMLLTRSGPVGLAEYYFYIACLTALVCALACLGAKLYLDRRARHVGDPAAWAEGPKRSLLLLVWGFFGFLAIWFLLLVGLEYRWNWVMALAFAPRSVAPMRYVGSLNLAKLAFWGASLNAALFLLFHLPKHRHHLPWKG